VNHFHIFGFGHQGGGVLLLILVIALVALVKNEGSKS
jgi:hypothetical protein